jgi:hypothetical protein
LWGLDSFAEDELVAVWILDDELVHLPFAWSEGLCDGNSCGAELGFEGGGGALDEVEVDAAGAMGFDETVRLGEVELVAVAIDEGRRRRRPGSAWR